MTNYRTIKRNGCANVTLDFDTNGRSGLLLINDGKLKSYLSNCLVIRNQKSKQMLKTFELASTNKQPIFQMLTALVKFHLLFAQIVLVR